MARAHPGACLQQIDHRSSVMFLKLSFQETLAVKSPLQTAWYISCTLPLLCCICGVTSCSEVKGRGFALFLPCFMSHTDTDAMNAPSRVISQ